MEENQKRIDLYNMDNKINYAFVTGREDTKFQGYVPKVNNQPHENSGVTIGTGFDLKDKTPEFLEQIGLEPEVVETLKRYLGLSGNKAQSFLDTAPLKLDSSVIRDIDKKAKAYYTANIAGQYEKATGYEKKFYDLSPAQQTVIYSVGFQYGSLNRTPKFLNYAVEGNWQGMYDELMDFKDLYPTRRKAEAELLLKELNNPQNIK